MTDPEPEFDADPDEVDATRVLVDFLGGSLDGTRLDTDSDDPSEVQRACAIFLQTDGTPGARFRAASEAGFEALIRAALDGLAMEPGTRPQPAVLRVDQIYAIEDCDVQGLTVHLRARFVGTGETPRPPR